MVLEKGIFLLVELKDDVAEGNIVCVNIMIRRMNVHGNQFGWGWVGFG